MIPVYLQFVLGLGPEFRGMMLGIYATPFILLQYPVGKLSNKHGRYRLLIPSSVGFGILLTIMGYLGLFGLNMLIISFVILGVFSGVSQPPSAALVGDLIEEKDNAMAMGFFNFVGNVGIILGPLVGGFMVEHFDFVFAFVIAGLLELISLGICILLIKIFQKKAS